MCQGRARGNPVFQVAALATDETGRLFVGDGHFLRYLHPENYRQNFDDQGFVLAVYLFPTSVFMLGNTCSIFIL